MVRDEKYFMQMALDKAWAYQGLTYPNPPVGAVITDAKDNFISHGVHEYAGGPHAEVNAIKSAYKKLTNDSKIDAIKNSIEIHEYLSKNHNCIFNDKTIYVTLEPCNHYGKTPPCANLIVELGFKKVFIGTRDPNKTASGGVDKLIENGLHVELGVLGKKCKSLIEPFMLWQEETFVFFKLAMSTNGVIDGGTVTCTESRKMVHAIRNKIDLLVIGGNTVRVDRPTLDARLCNGRAPDVLIYSKNKEFDKNIPLFSVPNRKVFIKDNFDKINDYNFVMIEGGEGMLNEVKKFVNWFLIFRSPHFKNGFSPSLEISLKEEFSVSIGEDRLSWFTKLNE
jgi:diaminohydroxyphosphoribosylaminopyrimidine deaminase/5-amino-6-(5-phosphoribosylamino)uracil reductase